MDFDVVYFHSMESEKIKLNINEVMRYMGQKKYDERVSELIAPLLDSVIKKAKPRASFVMKKLKHYDDGVLAGDLKIASRSLKKALYGCERAVFFSMTLGAEVDRLIAQMMTESAKAVAIDSIASALLEGYADKVCEELKMHYNKEGLLLLSRFGVGYGDFSLEHQRDIINACDGYKRCGIGMTEAMMLVPTKSITGIMGIQKEN